MKKIISFSQQATIDYMKRTCAAVVLLLSCGSSNDYRISVTGVSKATLQIESAVTSKTLRKFETNLQKDQNFSGAELGIGSDPIVIRIQNATYTDHDGMEAKFLADEELSTMYVKNEVNHTIDINPLTTIALCFLQHKIQDQHLSAVSIIEQYNKINTQFANQFEIQSLQGVRVDDEANTVLSNEQKYKLLVKGFEFMTSSLLVSVSEVATKACIDIGNDGILDGNDSVTYDDQTFKARLAGGVYQVFLRDDLKLNANDVFHFSDLISKNHDSEIFGSDTLDIPFETVPPDAVNWTSEKPLDQLAAETPVDVSASDSDSNPTFIKMQMQNRDTGETTQLEDRNLLSNRFQNTIVSQDYENGKYLLIVTAQDLFCNQNTVLLPVTIENAQ